MKQASAQLRPEHLLFAQHLWAVEREGPEPGTVKSLVQSHIRVEIQIQDWPTIEHYTASPLITSGRVQLLPD